MPIRNRAGGLHRGTLFDTNIPATSIDRDIFTDQEVLSSIAGDDLILLLDVSETPDVIKYMTRTNFVSGISPSTIVVTDNESTDEANLITFVADAGDSTGSHGIEMDGNLTYNPSTGRLSATQLAGTLQTASQTNITAVGTIATGTWEGTTVAVDQGGTGATSLNNLITLGTHTSGNYAASITAGTGLTSTGATSGESIAHSLSVDASQTQITAVGTIATGTWEGDTVAVAQGGTGATSLSNLITLATHTTGDYVQNITGGTGIDSTGATSGENIAHSLSIDLAEVGEVAIADGDYIAFMDATDSNATKKESLADVATLFAGTGLTASSSVLGVDAAQTQITSVGTLTGLTLDGNKSVTPGDGSMLHLDTSTITDSSTAGSGTAAKYTHVALEAPTLAATNASVTTSDAATLYINNAATAGTNQTITRNWAMWVDAGNARFDGSIYSGTTEALSSAGLVTVANQSNITGVGTIATGTWEGTTVAVAQGGTGATSLTNLITLATHTTGDYVQNVTAGTGLTSTGATSGENIAHSLSVDASQTQVTSVGALNVGSITSGFTSIDVGSGGLTTTGAIAGGTIDASTDFTIGGTVITDNTITDDGTLIIASSTATSFSDGNITNVGNIALDTISADATDISIAVTDNSATALTVLQGTDAYLIIDTADSSESVSIGTGISGTAIAIGHGTSETTFGDNVTITGDLTINGATVTNATTNLTVADPLVKYGQAYVGSAYDQGFIVTRGNGAASNTQNMGFIWDESADEFATIKAATEDGTTAGNVTVTDYVNLHVGAITADDTSVFSGSIELGHATDTTIARSGSGAITVEGTAVLLAGDALTGTTIDASTDFTIGDTVITNGVITDTSGLSIAAALALGSNTITTTGAVATGALTVTGKVLVSDAANATIPTDGTYLWGDNAGDMHLTTLGAVLVDLDANANNTDKTFSVRTNAGTTSLFSVTEAGTVATGALTVSGDTIVGNGYGLIVGHTAQVATGAVTAEVQVLGTGDADSEILIGRYSANTSGPILRFAKGRDAIGATTTILVDGDALGSLKFNISDVTDNNYVPQAASIVVELDGTPGQNDAPGRIKFSTTKDGEQASTEAMRITSTQGVHVYEWLALQNGKKLYFDTGSDTYIYEESADDLHITVGGAIMAQLDQEAGITTFNPSSADYDFKVLTDNGTAAISVDAGVNATAGSVTLGYTANPDANNRAWFKVYPPAMTTASGKSTSWASIQPDYVMTMAGTVPVAASLAVEEPNLSGTPTLAATLYIKDAPTEGVTNAAIHVAAGDVRLPSSVVVEGQDTAKFVADLYDICGDIRFLWMPSLTGTTVTDKSRHAATVTYSKEISTWDTTPSLLGRGIAADFDGTDEQADTPNNARLSFGDGANDEAFSMLVLMNPDAINADYGLLNKEVGTTREYLLRQTSGGKLLFHLWDESTNGTIIRTGTVNQSADTWALVGTTYDGSALASGMTIWKNGAVTASTATEDANYTAMEASSVVVSVGCLGDPAWFYNGEMAFALITAKELNADEQWAIKNLVNAFYNLAL